MPAWNSEESKRLMKETDDLLAVANYKLREDRIIWEYIDNRWQAENNVPATEDAVKQTLQQLIRASKTLQNKPKDYDKLIPSNGFKLLKKLMSYRRTHFLELAILNYLQKTGHSYPIPVITSTTQWMIQQVNALSEEASFVQKIMLNEREEYLRKVVRHTLQRAGRPVPVNQQTVIAVMQQVNLDFNCQCHEGEISCVAEEMQRYWDDIPSIPSRRNSQRDKLLEHYHQAMLNDQKSAQVNQTKAEKSRIEADYQQKRIDHYADEREEERRLNRLRSIKTGNWSPDFYPVQDTNEWISRNQANAAEQAARNAEEQAEYHQQSVHKILKRVKECQKLPVEHFTEGWVNFLCSEPFAEDISELPSLQDSSPDLSALITKLGKWGKWGAIAGGIGALLLLALNSPEDK